MKIKNIIKSLAVLIFSTVTLACLSISASADMGPKPSVNVKFKNSSDDLCYATLLSSKRTAGPYSAWDGTDYNVDVDLPDFEIRRAFVEYEDPDGFYFLQESWRIDETKKLQWTYHPPEKFKILLYYPETDTFISSGICEAYAFDSYFTVDMEGINISSVNADGSDSNELLEGRKSYNYWLELLAFVLRVCITFFIEIVIAKLFGYRHKKQLKLIIWTNIATQILLNVCMCISNYYLSFQWIVYFLLEFIVLLIEAIVYNKRLDRLGNCESNSKVSLSTDYVVIANGASFVVGYFISTYLLKWL